MNLSTVVRITGGGYEGHYALISGGFLQILQEDGDLEEDATSVDFLEHWSWEDVELDALPLEMIDGAEFHLTK